MEDLLSGTIGVVMAGGSGERFWPLSRASRPKQFLPLGSEGQSFLWEACDRLQKIVGYEHIWIATQPMLAALVHQAVPDVPVEQIVAEPLKRNTAGAIAWSTAELLARGVPTNSVIATLSADHRIHPFDQFASTFNSAVNAARSTGGLVTIGIRPDRPDTGYGYIEMGTSASGTAGFKVVKFHEKPESAHAEQYLAAGNYLWNSGMFFWTIDALLTELKACDPDRHDALLAISEALSNQDLRQATEIFDTLGSLSIDHALMERSSNVFVIESEFDWDDVGSWEALKRTTAPDVAVNKVVGSAHLAECSGNLVFNESGEQTVFLLGVHDLSVVVTQDAILVCPLDRSQDVKQVVELAKEHTPEST